MLRTLLTQFLGFRFLDFGDFRFRPHKAKALIFNHKSSII